MKCKQGDIAFIKKSIRPENMGKVVECKQLLGYFERGAHITWNGEIFIAYDTDHYWVIESKSGIETQYGKSTQAFIMDSLLTPIKADGLDDENTTDENIHDELVEEV